MRAKDYMMQGCYIDKRINSLVRQVNNLWDRATNVSPVLSDMPRNKRSSASKVEDIMVDIIDLTDEIKKQASLLKDKRIEIMGVISQVPRAKYQLILQEKYFEMLSWEDIAADIDKSVRCAQMMHGKALEEVQKILDKK